MKKLRKMFPVLQEIVNDHQIVYFDSASTAQMPQVVIDSIVQYYTTYKSNVGRGLYNFAEKTTKNFEYARENIANFIGAKSQEIIFTASATASINMVSLIWAQHNINSGDEIVVSEVEHHANFVPWQQLALKKGAILKIVPVNNHGVIDIDTFKKYLSSKTKFVSIVHQSNILGTTNDVTEIVKCAHSVGAKILIDTAQSIAHQKIDVKKIDCDFLVFSGHKLFGPTGVGVLFVKQEIFSECKPQIFGGGMVSYVTLEHTEFKKFPYCFEAGTQPIAQAIGLSAAIDFVREYIDFEIVQKHETDLVCKLVDKLQKIPLITIISPIPKQHCNVVTFVSDKYHAHDIAAYLDNFGIAVRAGNHCVQQYHTKHGISASVRVSFSAYNIEEEVDFLIECLNNLLM